MAQDIRILSDKELEGAVGGDQKSYETYAWMMTHFKNFNISIEEKLEMLDEAYDCSLTDGSLTIVERSKLEDLYLQEQKYYHNILKNE